MSFYTIKDLERLSSQKAHTIRIWEQRYALLEPERTETNIRVYNDDQLKKLLNVCALLERGMKISHISKLSKTEIQDEIEKIIAGSHQADNQTETIISQALAATATYDELLFSEMFSASVGILGLQSTYIKVIYPLLVRTGLMWTRDSLLPAQEHFLSNLVRQKLFAAINQIPFPVTADQTWLLFLNEQEDHEIGLLFANYLLRQNGKKVIYLGARVPYSNLSNVITNANPTHIYTFLVGGQPEQNVELLLSNLSVDFDKTTICFSGGDEKLMHSALNKGIIPISTIEGLLHVINAKNDL
jgi:DNA-binding transcriptional MerR regulator